MVGFKRFDSYSSLHQLGCDDERRYGRCLAFTCTIGRRDAMRAHDVMRCGLCLARNGEHEVDSANAHL